MDVVETWILCCIQFSSVQFCSRWYLRPQEKPIIMCSTPSLRNFSSVTLEMVPEFVWLTAALSRPFPVQRAKLWFYCRSSHLTNISLLLLSSMLNCYWSVNLAVMGLRQVFLMGPRPVSMEISLLPKRKFLFLRFRFVDFYWCWYCFRHL